MVTDDKTVRYAINPHEAAKIISEGTGKKVSPRTHWFRATMELTQELPPYAIISLEAIKRD